MSDQSAESAQSVLVVDDDVEFRAVVVGLLRAGGYDVAEAGTVAEGMRCHSDRPANLVVHDVDLRAGGRLTDEVVAFYQGQSVPVLALTGLPSSAPRTAAHILSKAKLGSLPDVVATGLISPANG